MHGLQGMFRCSSNALVRLRRWSYSRTDRLRSAQILDAARSLELREAILKASRCLVVGRPHQGVMDW
jgi:hypothetical protein